MAEGTSKRPGSGHGRMAPGWVKQGLQIPEIVRSRFADEAGIRGQTGVRNAGSVSLALYLGMPEAVRHFLYLWTVGQTMGDPNRLTPEATWAAFIRILRTCVEQAEADRRKAEAEPNAATVEMPPFVTMILDPDFDWSVLDKIDTGPTRADIDAWKRKLADEQKRA